ncbi:DUF2125 domain-containing protein [Rhodospirillum sp. A1_3_36]|uniref:DUF2125 domain-containing protein n=1 Tax=Rhodospirillum sp. A1_3_36 TaxID=3391666 RepID=UPI0039A60A47
MGGKDKPGANARTGARGVAKKSKTSAKGKYTKAATDDPLGRPISGRDPRFHSPNAHKKKSPRKPKKKPLLTRVYVWGPMLMLGFVCVYIGFWFYAAKVATLGLTQWVADRRMEGYTISHGPIDVGGFPLAVTVTIPSPSITAPPDFNAWSWSTTRLSARINPFNPSAFVLNARGRHDLNLPLGPEGRLLPVTISGRAMGGYIDVDSTGNISETDLHLTGVTLAGLPGGAGAISSLNVKTKDRALYGDPDEKKYGEISWSMQLRGSGITVPSAYSPGLSKDLSSLTLDMNVYKNIPGGPLHEALKTWREEGGYISVDTLSLAWPPLTARGSGTLGLDDELQPAGNFTLRTQGLLTMIDGMGRQGWANPAEADMARMVISGMAKDSGISTPITIRRRSISVGPAKLVDLPTIYWGGKGARSLNRIAPGFEINRDGQVVRDGQVETRPLPDILAPIGRDSNPVQK